MIWESPFPFNVLPDKCTYSYVMGALSVFAKDTPDKKVLISAEDTENFITYSQLLDQIKAAESFLHKINFGHGDIATAIIPSAIETVPFYIAVMGRGGIYSGMSPLLTKFEIHRQLSYCKSKVIFTSGEMVENVKAGVEELKKEGMEPFVITLGEIGGWGSATWEYVLKSEGIPPSRNNNISDVAIMPYSSGTTGMPKGVQLTHNNLMSAVLNGIEQMKQNVPQPTSSQGESESIFIRNQVLAMPLYHMSGKIIIIGNLIVGSTTVVLKEFNFRLFLETIQNFKVYNLFLTPAVLLLMVKYPIAKEYDLSSIGYVTSVAAPLGVDLAKQFIEMCPKAMLTQTYGMSECLGAFLPKCDKKDNFLTGGCLGPGFKAKIVDIATGEALGPNESGEIVIIGPGVMKGYLNNQKATEESIDKDGWLHTGDIGYMNDEGDVFVVDRIKEMIKVDGKQVSPAEIECALSSDPRVRDVGVVGVPSPVHGEIPCAFVVKAIPDLCEADVEKLIKERIASYKWSDGIIRFVERIPKNSTGKILRRELLRLIEF